MSDFLIAQPEGPAAYETQQHVMDHCLSQLRGEFIALWSKEADQRKRVEDLTRDRDALKTLYNSSEKEKSELRTNWIATMKQAEREKVELENQINALRGAENRVVCLIDGDGTIFSSSLLSQGREGGRLAARTLTESIYHHLSSSNNFHEYQLWVYIFYNKSGMMGTLARAGLKEESYNSEEFMIGFNQAGERFLMVDVGNAKEAADAKIRVYLEDNIRLPQTWKLIFGGCHDNGYVTTLTSTLTAGFGDKLILLPGYTDIAAGIEELRLPTLKIPGLFMAEKMRARSPSPPLCRAATPKAPPGLSPLASVFKASGIIPIAASIVPTLPSLSNDLETTATVSEIDSEPVQDQPTPKLGRPAPPSYKSALQSVQVIANRAPTPELDATGSCSSSDSSGSSGSKSRSSSLSKGRFINPNIPLSKNNPPPCTLFYLASCKYGAECIYAHDYSLEEEHFDVMRQNAKKSPCPAANKNEMCSFGDTCLYGHKCPMAPKCHFMKQGVCKFLGAGMHRE